MGSSVQICSTTSKYGQVSGCFATNGVSNLLLHNLFRKWVLVLFSRNVPPALCRNLFFESVKLKSVFVNSSTF